MTTALKMAPNSVHDIPFQPASLDIWDNKYRLKAKDGSQYEVSSDLVAPAPD